MEPLRLENGKFMRGKEEVAPVIGNREQIDLLRRVEREMDERERLARGGKLDVEVGVEDITYYVRCVFTCICGHRVSARDVCYADAVEEIDDDGMYDADVKCPRCGRWYEVNDRKAKLSKF